MHSTNGHNNVKHLNYPENYKIIYLKQTNKQKLFQIKQLWTTVMSPRPRLLSNTCFTYKKNFVVKVQNEPNLGKKETTIPNSTLSVGFIISIISYR